MNSRGVAADVFPHLWSGANSALGRERAANDLAISIKDLAKRYRDIHVIGHSHGGNVANDAARILRRRSKNARHAITSLTTVGTPFFRSGLSAANTFGWWALLAALGVSALLFIAQIVANYGPDTIFAPGALEFLRERRAALSAWSIDPRTFLLANLLALVLIIPPVLQGARRMLRVHARRHGSSSVLCIWHPGDEAIGFLQKLEEFPIEALPAGALWRGARITALVAGTRAVLLMLIGGLITIGVGVVGIDASFVQAGGLFAFYTLAAAPILFSIVYLLVRLFAGGVPEWFARRSINAWVSGLLRGMAFGRDGDERLGQVAVRPHGREAREVVLAGEVAERMQADAAGAAGALLEKYRWALFTVGVDTTPSIAALARDAMTWRSLIHTTYFDQLEVAALIGEHIAGDSAPKSETETPH